MRDPTKAGPIVARSKARVGKGLPRFQPGDLVTAEALNAIIDAVNALADRVAALEMRCP